MRGLAGQAAHRLFTQRARAAHPTAELDPDLVGQLCQALDGLPLALELAAARLRHLPLAEVLRRLDDRFALLAKGERTAAPRHRGLTEVVAWSWDLLTPAERDLAARFTVFAGSADLAAVTAVCAADLDGLVDKSLVELTGQRYRMPETIRAFCARQAPDLAEAPRRAHAAHFLALARTASPELLRADQLTWLARLDAEHDNLVGALRWATAHDHPTALRLAGALAPYWWLRGRRTEGARLTGPLTRALGTTPPPGLAEEYALCVLTTAFGSPDPTPWHPHLDAVRRDHHARTTAPRQPLLWVLLAMVDGPPADHTATNRYRRLFEADPWSAALARLSEGVLAAFRGADAEPHLTAALAAFRALGERWGMLQALADLAPLADWPRALSLYAEGLRLAEELGATEEAADLVNRRACGHLDRGELDAARVDLARVAELGRRAGAPDWVGIARLGQAELARHTGDLPAARALAEQALAVTWPGVFPTEELRCRAQLTLARLARTEGHPDVADSLLREALAVATARRNHPLVRDLTAELTPSGSPTPRC
ncbi:hypothetical protein JOF53_006724 [Crossiella equi]|uniref:Tetratricopeptide repeat protein n=1 Tax=Crossiella equi TaxID=130796 RepID=A0ABS5AN82_9PSEU|nr:hypothetical protein [Crossiella equi]MBP2477852.1 hypothetical protein [Crossiella equi]